MYGNRLKQARQNKNLSQEKVAEILNISRSNISKYENEDLEPNMQMLKELCQIYNVSADYIIGLNDKIEIKKENIKELRLVTKRIKETNQQEIMIKKE